MLIVSKVGGVALQVIIALPLQAVNRHLAHVLAILPLALVLALVLEQQEQVRMANVDQDKEHVHRMSVALLLDSAAQLQVSHSS